MNTERLDSLVQRVRAIADPAARDAALELVQAVMDLHASSLEQMMDILHESGAGAAAFDAFAADAQVSNMLLLHDLHPLDLEQRVRRALAQPAFRTVEVLSVRDGAVRVRLEGGSALRGAVEQALAEAAPDADAITVEGGTANHSNGFVPLTQLLAG